MYLSVLFADTDPQAHPQRFEAWTSRLVDYMETYHDNISNEDLEHLKEVERARNFYVKGVYDYKYVLERCLSNTKAPYIAIFEDDLVFAEGWMTRTLHALAELKRRQMDSVARTLQPSQRWIYLRLFYTETSLRWQNSDFWYRNMLLAFALTSSFGCLTLLFIRHRWPKTVGHLDNASIAVISLITVPAFTALVFMIGKYSLSPLHGVVPMDRYGCCTQAMIFPRGEVVPLLRYLNERQHGQTDSLIEEYADRDGLARFALAPQVVQHIGLVSSRDNTLVNTQSNWAFWFETNNPVALRKEHDRDFKTIPWELLGGG
jgi:hypothetical protein